MKTTSILLSLIAASLLSFGCNKSKSDDKKTDPETAGKTTGTEPNTPETPAADAAPAAASKEIPTEQDFEEKAATEVTKDNVEAEVEKMEKELASESGAAAAGGDKAPAGGDKAPAGGENK
jgi:hypothetical protein